MRASEAQGEQIPPTPASTSSETPNSQGARAQDPAVGRAVDPSLRDVMARWGPRGDWNTGVNQRNGRKCAPNSADTSSAIRSASSRAWATSFGSSPPGKTTVTDFPLAEREASTGT